MNMNSMMIKQRIVHPMNKKITIFCEKINILLFIYYIT